MPLMTVLTGPLNPRDAPACVSEAVLSAALCPSMEGHLAAPGDRVSGDTNAWLYETKASYASCDASGGEIARWLR